MSSQVPTELMERFRNANDAFAQARSKFKDLETMDTKQRGDAAAALRSAEKVLEDLEKEISAFLHATPPAAGTMSQPGAQ